MVERVRARPDLPRAALYLGVMLASGLSAHAIATSEPRAHQPAIHHWQRPPAEPLDVMFIAAPRSCAFVLTLHGVRVCEPSVDVEVWRRVPVPVEQVSIVHWRGDEVGADGHPAKARVTDRVHGWHRASTR